jgi:hypothetical protein
MALTRPTKTQVENPNIIKHRVITFTKSALRIVACYFLAYYDLQIAAGLLLLAELLGVAEELV